MASDTAPDASLAALAAWRERTAHQLQAKLRRTQPHLSSSQVQHALASIEHTLHHALTPTHPSLSPSPSPSPSVQLHSTDLPTLLSLQSSAFPFYSDVDHLVHPIQQLTRRELAFAASFPSPPPSLRLLPAQPRLLVGRLSADGASPQRLLLIDDTASIPCHLIHADVALLDRVVFFLRWSLLLTAARPSEAALEVDASQAALLSFAPSPAAVMAPSASPPTQLYPLHQLSHRQMKRLSASSRVSSSARPAASRGPHVATTSRLPPCAPERPLRPILHVCGVVVAKSPMVQRKDGVFHFVELTPALSRSPSVFVLFNGAASVRFYHVLHVDNEYVFANVRAKALQAGGRVQFVLLASTVACSTPPSAPQSHAPSACMQLFNARSSHLPTSAMPCTTPSDPSARQPSLPSARPPRRCRRTVSYVGMITKQVAMCVYELDHNWPSLPHSSSPPLSASSSSSFSSRHDPLTSRFSPTLRLYLTRYDCGALYDGLALRPGCVVHLHHVHRLYHSGRFLGLGCCARSHVSIVSFSPLSAVCRPLHRDGEQRLLWSVYQQLNLPDIALFVDVMESLMKKWGRACKRQLLADAISGSPGLLRRLLHDRLHWGYTDDIYQQVMDHDASCHIADPSNAAPTFTDRSYPTFPSLSSLFDLPAVSRAFERLRRRLRQDDHSSTAWHCERIPYSSLTQPGLVFTGYLSSSLSTHTSQSYTIPPPGIVIDADDSSAIPDVTSVYTGLHLTDSSSSTAFAVDCVVVGDCGEEQLDGCYQLTDFELVLETVPFPAGVDSSAARASTSPASTAPAPHVVAYLLLPVSCLVPLIPRPSPPPSTEPPLQGIVETSLTLYITHRLTRVVPAPLGRTTPVQLACLPLGSAPSDQSKRVDLALHVSSRSSSGRCTQNVECSLRALLVTSDTTEPRRVQLNLKGDTLAFIPLVHSGQVIHLSSCRRTRRLHPTDADEDGYDTTPPCSLSIDSSPAALDWTQRMRPHLPPCWSVAQLLVCDVSVFGDGRVDPTPCSFTGEVVEKQFRCDPLAHRQGEGVRRSHSAPPQSLSSTSSSLSQPGRWCVRLRDVRLSHTVELYASLSSRVFPAGVVPGAVVRVSGALRKLAPTWKLFVECTAQSELSVLSTRPADVVSSASMPSTVPLSTFSLIPLTLRQWIYRVRCRVVQVKRLRVSVNCLFCARVVASTVKESDRSQFTGRWRSRDGRCGLTSCRRLELRLSAQVIVDDGTSAALTLIEGPTVWDVLGLHRRDVDLVKHVVGELGEVDYSDHQQSSADLQRAQRKRKRGRGQWGCVDEEAVSSEDEAAPLEPDYAALKRERLAEMFREGPRGRCVALHVQQLVLGREMEAHRAWVRRRRAEGVRAAESRKEMELDLLLSSAVRSEMRVGGDVHAMERPAGWLTFRVLHCEPVRAADEVRALLAHSSEET